jgi:hypothetical protein
MNAEQSSTSPSGAPLAELERTLIEGFIRERGYDPLTLADLPDDTRAALLKDASVYASGKLMEVEARSHFVHELHSGSPEIKTSGRG